MSVLDWLRGQISEADREELAQARPPRTSLKDLNPDEIPESMSPLASLRNILGGAVVHGDPDVDRETALKTLDRVAADLEWARQQLVEEAK